MSGSDFISSTEYLAHRISSPSRPDIVPSYSPGPPSPFPPSSYNSGPVPPPFYHHPSSTAGLDLLASSSTAPMQNSSFSHLDQHVQQQQQQQQPQPSHSAFPFPSSSTGNPHLQRGSPGSITDYHSPPDFSPSSSSQPQSQSQPPPLPRPSPNFQTNSQASRPLSRKFNTFPPTETSPSSFGPSASTPTPSSNLRESHSREESPAHDERILSLLWPGYPPHLPSPGFLQHVVEVYFNAVPMSNCQSLSFIAVFLESVRVSGLDADLSSSFSSTLNRPSQSNPIHHSYGSSTNTRALPSSCGSSQYLCDRCSESPREDERRSRGRRVRPLHLRAS